MQDVSVREWSSLAVLGHLVAVPKGTQEGLPQTSQEMLAAPVGFGHNFAWEEGPWGGVIAVLVRCSRRDELTEVHCGATSPSLSLQDSSLTP